MASFQSNTGNPRVSSRKYPWALLAKGTVTIAFFCFLFSQIDVADCLVAITESLGYWLISAIVVNSTLVIVSVLKWDQLLRALRIVISRWRLIEVYMIGFFMSSVLPGVFGGDVIRCYITGKGKAGHLSVATTILIERFTGVVTLVGMCVVVVLFDTQRFATAPTVLLIGGMSVALVGSLVLALNRRLVTTLTFKTRKWKLTKAFRLVYKVHRTFRSFSRRDFFISLAYSVVFYIFGGLVLFCVCRAFGTNLSFWDALTVQILVCLLTVLPISVGGLGLTQAGDVYLLGILGIEAPRALGISLMRQIVQYVYVAVGGIIFMRWRDRPQRSAPVVDVPRKELEV
jgi:uncharacterized protein (TIRG00374 family)